MNKNPEQLKSLACRLEDIEQQILRLEADADNVFWDAYSQGFDFRALRTAVYLRMRDFRPEKVEQPNATQKRLRSYFRILRAIPPPTFTILTTARRLGLR